LKEYRLNVDLRILELLGPNLYTNIYYVLAELIANAYDADARNVYIILNEDNIKVEDDGHGMSYDAGDIKKYLNVAGVSRSTEEESFSKLKKRRKIGRKGIGKLAALSVSEDVKVLTVANGEKSGFVLTRRPEHGDLLKSIPENEISFDQVNHQGTAIIMLNPQHRLHKTLSAIKRNLLRIFPLVNKDFRIHIIREKDKVVIDTYDEDIMFELNTLITLGDRFSHLCSLVPNTYSDIHGQLVEPRKKEIIPIKMKNTDEIEKKYPLEIEGWIGTYKSTRGRKAEMTDFPDNFISLFANRKLGEFNILPTISQNKLNEVFVVGQLHVDLFEQTELPDMALSNRQGYKTDDPRYEAVIEYVRGTLLKDILKKRDIYTDRNKANTKLRKEQEQKDVEDKLKKSVDTFRKKASNEATNALVSLGVTVSKKEIKKVIVESLNVSSIDLGLKAVVDSQKKKILISQTSVDKSLADVIYQMLLFNNVIPEDILYTNCDDETCRVPEGRSVYDYLRDFFVESYSNQKIFVLFITSENMKNSWGAVVEVGASWITRIDHKIFNILPFRPEHPLNDEEQWQNTNREGNDIWMSEVDADILCQKIEAVCDKLSCNRKDRNTNINHLRTLVSIRKIWE